MSFDSGIEFPFGMKYDISNLIKTSLKESYTEIKEYQKNIRNELILLNESEKKKSQEKKVHKKNIKFKFYKKEKEVNIIDISKDNLIPKGYFCYPIKNPYFQKSSLEFPFFPLLNFKQFKEGMDTFDGQKNLSETYLAYPCLLRKDYIRIKDKILKDHNINDKKSLENINLNLYGLPIRPSNYTSNINKYFIIWCFIKIIKGQSLIMGNDFNKIYSQDKNKIVVPIVKKMSEYLNIDLNILYYIINTFLSDIAKKIKKDSLNKKGISYKKYEKYWCRICNRFFCPFHFKIKVKTNNLDEDKIRTTYEYLKKIQITLRPPEYVFKEKEESDINKDDLNNEIRNIISNCDCCNKKGTYFYNDDNNNNNNNNFVFDESLKFNKMAQIKDKEDFFILCKFVKTCDKLLNKSLKGVYDNNKIFSFFLSPCVLRKILHDKYDCDLLRYLKKLIIDNKYLSNINLFLEKLSGIEYEKLPEENLLFFNNTIDSNFPEQKYTEKGEQKITKILRTKTTARLQVQSEKNLYYKPCDHYPAECTPENCACAKIGICLKYCCCFKEEYLGQSNGRCPYMFLGCQNHKSPKTICSKCDCINNNIECVPGICSCREDCTNNDITLGRRKKLIYGYSNRINGGGLFAGELIESGDFVDIYQGEIVEKEELDRLSVFYDQTGNNYPFNINEKFDYVAIKCGGLTRYINHGAFGEENIKADKRMVNGIPYIAFYASKDIKKYEELFYNYSYDANSMPEWMKEYNREMKMKNKKNNNANKNNKNQISQKKGNLVKKNKEKEKGYDVKNKRNFINLDEEEDD